MSETSPETGIATALTDLSEQTRRLVREEIDDAQAELWQRAKGFLPVVGLASVAGVTGWFALVSAHTWTLRVLERRLPPATAAFVAAGLYGGGAAAAAIAAAARLREAPAPFPAETAQRTAERLGAAAEAARA